MSLDEILVGQQYKEEQTEINIDGHYRGQIVNKVPVCPSS